MKRAPGYSCRELVGRDSERGYECVLPRVVIALRGTVKSKTTSREPTGAAQTRFQPGKRKSSVARPYERSPGRAQRGRRTPYADTCRSACRQRTYPGREMPNPITVDIVRGGADLSPCHIDEWSSMLTRQIFGGFHVDEQSYCKAFPFFLCA